MVVVIIYLFIYRNPNKLLPVPRLTSAGDVRLTDFPGRPAVGCHSSHPRGQGIDPRGPGPCGRAKAMVASAQGCSPLS